MHVFSTYSLECVRSIQIPPSSNCTIAFNYNDSRLVVLSEDGQIQSFDLEDWKKVGENRSDRAYSYKHAVYLQHELNTQHLTGDDSSLPSNMLLAVGT